MSGGVLLQPRVYDHIEDLRTQGHLDCVVVRGEPTAGKTEVLDAVAAASPGQNVRLSIRSGTLQEQLPYLAATVVQLSQVTGMQAEPMYTRLLSRLAAIEVHEGMFGRLVPVMEQLLSEYEAPPTPVWFLIDNADQLHPELLQLLRHAIARTAHWPGGFICTGTRPIPQLAPFQTITLNPLTAPAVIEWIQKRTGVRPPYRVAEVLRDWTDGHIALLHEVVGELESEALQGSRALVPGFPGARTRNHAKEALERLPDAHSKLVQRIGAVGDIDLPTLAALAEESGLTSEEVIARGEVMRREDGRFTLRDSLLRHALMYAGDENDRDALVEDVLRIAGDVLSTEDKLLFSALVRSRDSAHLSCLEEAALSAELQGQSARAFRLSRALVRHSDAGSQSMVARVSSLLAIYSGHLYDALEIAQGELRRPAPPVAVLTSLRIYQVASYLLNGTFDPADAVDTVNSYLDSEPDEAVLAAEEAIVVGLEVGRISQARDLYHRVHERLGAHRQPSGWASLGRRLYPRDNTAAAVEIPSGGNATKSRSGQVRGTGACDLLLLRFRGWLQHL